MAFLRHLFSQQEPGKSPEAISITIPTQEAGSGPGRQPGRCWSQEPVLQPGAFPLGLLLFFHLCCRIPWAFPSWSLGASAGLGAERALDFWSILKGAEFSSQRSLPLQVFSAPFRGCSAASACVGLESLAAEGLLCCFHDSQEKVVKMSLLLERESAPGHTLVAAVCRGTAQGWNCSCNDLLAFIPWG